MGFEQRVKHGSQRNQKKTEGLDGTGRLLHGCADDTEHLFSGHAANRRTDGQRRANLQVNFAFSGTHGFCDGIATHGQHRTSGQKADGGNTVQMEQIQGWFDDDAAANAANRSGDTGKETDDKICDYLHGEDTFLQNHFIFKCITKGAKRKPVLTAFVWQNVFWL